MICNPVKQTLASGGIALGTMVFEFHTTGIARIAAAAGAEFVVFDMEHTGWSVETVRTLMATSPLAQIVPLVRVPATEYHFLARVLDAGALGIMVPMVESAEQGRQIIEFCRYPPAGRRGAAFGIAHDKYTDGDVLTKMQAANREVLLIAQIETRHGLENLDAIASIDGLDVLWIGHFDLTSSLGIPGQFDHPEFHRALHSVVQACRRYGKAAGFMASSVEEAHRRLEQGFRCLAFGGDLWIYQQALRQGLSAVRSRVGHQ